MFDTIKVSTYTAKKVGIINQNGKVGFISYIKPLANGPIVNPKAGAAKARPITAPWFVLFAFKEAEAVYPGEAKPIPKPIKAMPTRYQDRLGE